MLCEFSSVRGGVADIALRLGYDAASLCIRLQQFRDSVVFSFFLHISALEDENITLHRNFWNRLQSATLSYARKT